MIKEESEIVKQEPKVVKRELKDKDQRIRANDVFDKLFKDGNKTIGEERNFIILNNEFIDDFQIFTCIQKIIGDKFKSDEFGLMYGEALFKDISLVTHLNEHYKSTFKSVFISIYYRENHWYLLTIDLVRNALIIMDSMVKNHDNQYLKVFKRSYKMLQLINKIDSNRQFDIKKYKFLIVNDCPSKQLIASIVECTLFFTRSIKLAEVKRSSNGLQATCVIN